MCRNGASQVGTNQGAVHNLPESVGHINVPELQFIDGPAIVSAHASFRLAFSGNRLRHVRPHWHVLRRQSTSGKGLLNVQDLPSALKLVSITLLTEVVPDIFDCYVDRPLQ